MAAVVWRYVALIKISTVWAIVPHYIRLVS